MYNIKKLNPISDVVSDYLKTDIYNVADDATHPEGILVRSASMHDYDFNDELLCIARAGAGYNNIPYEDCGENGIVVFNTPGANANGVKELLVCGLLLSARGIYDGIEWVNSQKNTADIEKLIEKQKKKYAGGEIAGKTLGIIGMGAIGALVANAAIGMNMDAIGFDPFLTVESAMTLSRSVLRAASEDELYSKSDFISLHLPLLDVTRGKINKDALAKCKDGVVILNLARGELVNDDDMLAALKSGKVKKYVTDFPNSKLINEDGVITIPHLGASTQESEVNCAIMASKQVRDYLENGNIKNSVNMPECYLGRSGEYRLTIIHKNVKNMVGQITGTLAEENHNITNMINMSRTDLAYTMIDIDDSATDLCIEKLRNIDGIIRVRHI